MLRWTIAFGVAALITVVAIPAGRRRAFKAGFFERSTQTRRSRSARRPTHGGLVVAIAVGAGALVAGPTQPAAQATAIACVAAIVGGFQADRGRDGLWWLRGSRLVAAVALPLAGIRVPLTGTVAMDWILTAAVALLLMRGVRSIERTDATAPLVAGLSALALLVIAVDASDPVAPVAAALLGACGAFVAHAWPPATVRLGTIGPTALGAGLASVVAELEPVASGPREMLIPWLTVVVLLVAAVVPAWDRRLSRRGVPPRVALALATTAAGAAAVALALDEIATPLAVAVAIGPALVLSVTALTVPRPRPQGWVPHRGRNLALSGLAIVVLGAVAAIAGLELIDARRSMESGRDFATAGLDAARDGDLDTAQVHFAAADDAFAAAATGLDKPFVRTGELVPGIGPNLRSARALAAVGGDLSSTAVAVAERAGADDLLVVDGRFPVEAARGVAAQLSAAVATLESAATRLEAADSPLLVPEVRAGADDVGDRIEAAGRDLEVVEQATRLAPSLLGADGERRWMLAVLTPAEQRGAGGLAGDYAELRTLDGDIELVQTRSAAELNAATAATRQLDALPSIYNDRYSGFRLGRFWQNLSATPDIPSFAQGVASSYPLLPDGAEVDGFITLDPYAIAALLELSGPVSVPDWPVPLTSENAASVLLFEHYNTLTREQIANFQSDLIETLVDKLTAGTLPAVSQMAGVLGPQLAGGHLRLWSADDESQALFRRIGADGTLGERPEGADFVQLVTQNGGENKIDWYLRRGLSYDVSVDPGSGSLVAEATVTITNTAPASGVSSIIIGEQGGPTTPGSNELEVTILSPHRLVLVTDAAGDRLPVNLGRERGLNAVTVRLDVPAGGQATVAFTLAGSLRASDGGYRLVVGRQPAVAPDQVDVVATGANGWHLDDPESGQLSSAGDTQEHLNVRFVR